MAKAHRNRRVFYGSHTLNGLDSNEQQLSSAQCYLRSGEAAMRAMRFISSEFKIAFWKPQCAALVEEVPLEDDVVL